MRVTDKSPFVITHWPGGPVPVPSVFVADVEIMRARIAMWDSFEQDMETREEWRELVERSGLSFVREEGRWFFDTHLLLSGLKPPWPGYCHAEVPDELYLRSFLDLDAGSPQAVGEFCARFGLVGIVGDREGDWDVPDDWPAINAESEPPLLQLNGFVTSAARRWLRTWQRPWLRTGDVSEGTEVQGLPTEPFTSVAEIRWFGEVAAYQSFLHDVCNLWDFLTGGRSFDSLVADWTSEQWGWGLYEPRPEDGLGEARVAQMALEGGLNPALSCFTVRVVATDPDEPAGAAAEPWARHSIYSDMCLQLANKISRQTPFRRCKNERCGRLFDVKAASDSKWHRYRGLASYCSDECANRQTQREHRRRKRDAKLAAAEALKADSAPTTNDEGDGDEDT